MGFFESDVVTAGGAGSPRGRGVEGAQRDSGRRERAP